MTPDFHKVFVYARIIDIQHETIDIVLKTTKAVKRWKYRPCKTSLGNWRRIGKVLVMGFQVKNLAVERYNLLRSLGPPFIVGGIVGPAKPEQILDLKSRTIPPGIERDLKNNNIISIKQVP